VEPRSRHWSCCATPSARCRGWTQDRRRGGGSQLGEREAHHRGRRPAVPSGRGGGRPQGDDLASGWLACAATVVRTCLRRAGAPPRARSTPANVRDATI